MKAKQLLSLFLSILMIFSMMTVAGPLTVTADEGNTVTFLDVDDSEICKVTITSDMTTFADVVKANADAAAKETCVSQNDATNPYLTTVFAGWADTTDSTKVFTKSTPVNNITGDITVKATYDNTVEVVTAYDIYTGFSTSTKKSYHDSTNYELHQDDASRKLYLRMTAKGESGTNFRYVMYTSPADWSAKTLIAKGVNYAKDGADGHPAFFRDVTSASGGKGATKIDAPNTKVIGEFTSTLDSSGSANFETVFDSTYGINFAPWNGQGAPVTNERVMDLEYFAVATNANVKEYIDIAQLGAEITILNEDGTTNTNFSGKYPIGYTVNLPAQQGKYFIDFVENGTTTAVATNYKVTNDITLKPDTSSKTRAYLFSAHDGSLVTKVKNATYLTKDTELMTKNGVKYVKYTVPSTQLATTANTGLHATFYADTEIQSNLTYANYPVMGYGFDTNITSADWGYLRLDYTTKASVNDIPGGNSSHYHDKLYYDSGDNYAYVNAAKYADGDTDILNPISLVQIRPWFKDSGATATADEYFALGYIAFFKNVSQAAVFNYADYINSIEVTIKDQNGTVIGTVPYDARTAGNKIDLSAWVSSLPAFAQGYSLAGWMVDGDEGNVIASGTVDVTEDVTYQAVAGQTVNVTVYDKDDQIISSLSGEHVIGQTIKLPVQSGKYMFDYYEDGDANKTPVSANYIISKEVTLIPDVENETEIILFSAHDDSLKTVAKSGEVTKETDLITDATTGIKYVQYTENLSTETTSAPATAATGIYATFYDSADQSKLTIGNGYKVIRYEYKTNITSNTSARVDYTNRSYINTNSFNTNVWNVGPLSYNASHTVYTASTYGDNSDADAPVSIIQIRPWMLSSSYKTPNNDEYFALGYIGFFKTAAQAEAFDYNEYVNAVYVTVKDRNGDVQYTDQYNKVTTPTINLNTAYASLITPGENEEFVGWAINDDATNLVEDPTNVALTEDVTYTPIFGDSFKITFYASADDYTNNTPIVPAINTTDATPIKDIVAENADVAAYEYTHKDKVFAGWQIAGTETILAKNSTISTSTSVIATYSNAYIITANDLNKANSEDPSRLVGTSGAALSSGYTFNYDLTGAAPKVRLTKIDDTSSKSFVYKFPEADGVNISVLPYMAVKGTRYISDEGKYGVQGSEYRFVKSSESVASGNSTTKTPFLTSADGLEKGVALDYEKNWEIPSSHIDALTDGKAYGLAILPEGGSSINAGSYTDIEYYAFLEKQSAIDYLDVSQIGMMTVKLDGTDVIVYEDGSIFPRISEPQKKEADGYKVAAGFTVAGETAERSLLYILTADDAGKNFTTVYKNAYVFTPYQLNHAAHYSDTQGEIVDGKLRVTSTKDVGYQYESGAAWANSFVYFQITDDEIAAKPAASDYQTVNFKINDAPYYSITYNTNIAAKEFANNMYTFYSNKWDRVFPQENRVTGRDHEFGVDLLTHSALENSDKDKGVTAVRIGIYHQGNMNNDNADLTIGENDYFDISYLGFFPSKASEAIFDYAEYLEATKVTVDLTIDGEAANIGEKYAGEVYDLPTPEAVPGEKFMGYMNADGKLVTKGYATANAVELTSYSIKDMSGVTTYTTEKGNLANLLKAATDNGKLTVAYIGGSITQGSGATGGVDNAYAGRVTAAIEGLGITVDPKYMGLGGTGSRLGAHRLADDIIANNPDLVFVEFAVNDSYCKEWNATADEYNGIYYEYIIRTIREELPNTEIVALFTTDHGKAISNSYNTASDYAIAQKEIADYYNVTSIDVGRYLLESICQEGTTKYPDNIWNIYFADTVHPTNAGHQIYAEAIAEYLAAATMADVADAAKHTVPAAVLYEGADVFAANTVALEDVTIVSGFTLDQTATEGNCYTGKLVPDRSTEYTGDYKLSFEFTGTELSLYMNSPKTAAGAFDTDCQITVQVDELEAVTLPAEGKSHYNTNGPKVFYEGLENTTHTATVTYSKKPAMEGNIIAILTGGVAEAYKVNVIASVDGMVFDGSNWVQEYNINVKAGDAIRLEAKPNNDYVLRNWYDITNGHNISILGLPDEDVTSANWVIEDYVPTKNMTINANFMSNTISFPVRLRAMVGENAMGTIEGKPYYEGYVPVGETVTLTAVPNPGYEAYWKRISSRGRAEIFVSLGNEVAAEPYGGDVFYQPEFVNATTTVYIDDSTRTIIGVVNGEHDESTQPDAPSKTGYEFDKYVVAESNGYVTVMKTKYTKGEGQYAVLSVYDIEGEIVKSAFSPVRGEGYLIKATDSNTTPKWTMSVGGNDYIVSFADEFNFNYMFKENTEVTVTEGSVEATDPEVAIGTAAAWTDGSITYFTGAWAVSEDVTHVEHGVLLSTDSDLLTVLEAGTEFDPDTTVTKGNIKDKFDGNGDPIAPTAVYTIQKTDASGTPWYGRAYLIYKIGGTQYVAYGETLDNAGNVVSAPQA